MPWNVGAKLITCAHVKRHYLLALLVLSGFAGLGYEVLWIRLLALAIGSTTLSFAVVLSVFFGGLALGSRWAGKRVGASQRPVATYAALEAITGGLGLALYPLMKNAGWLLAAIEPPPGPLAVIFRFVFCVLLMLPPTFLMGATLPYVCAATIDRDDEAGRGTALIYGFNTVGACLGAYGLTFWLLPYLGVFKSVLVVCGASLTVAAVAFIKSRRPGGEGPVAAAAPAAAPEPAVSEALQKRDRLALMAAFVGGLVATGAQVVWARLFAISLKGTAYGIGSVLVAVLVGLALGSLLAGRLAKRSTNLVLTWGAVQLAMVAGIVFFTASLPVFHYVLQLLDSGGFEPAVFIHLGLAGVLVSLLVPTIASGASLPLLVAVVERSARDAGASLARVYVANTVGCILGSAITGFALLPVLGTNRTLYMLLVLLVGAMAVFVLIAGAEVRVRGGLMALAAVGLVAVYPGFDAAQMVAPLQVGRDYFTDQQRRREIASRIELFYEGDIASVAVQRTRPMQGWGLTLNGLGQGGLERLPPYVPLESVLVGTVPWLHAKQPDNAMIVGLGAAGTVKALLELGIKKIEVAELEGGVLDANEVMWGDRNPARDPRVEVRRNDARHQLMLSAAKSPRHYDIIASMPAHPWVAPSLFTREFFEIVAKNLAPGGVFSTWFGVGEMDPRAIEGLFGAFTSVFPHYIVYWVPEARAFYAVGSVEEFSLHVDRFEQIAKTGLLQGHDPSVVDRWFLPLRAVAASLPGSPETPSLRVNSDDNAIIEFFGSRKATVRSNPIDLLPHRFLPAERVDVEGRDAFFVELAERALRSNGGRLPSYTLNAAARRLVEGVLPALSPDARAYVELRIALAEGKLEGAEEAAEKIGDPLLAERARRFVAASQPAAQRRAALRALPRVTPGVAALLVSGGDDLAGLTVDVASDDPLGLLFSTKEQARERLQAEGDGWQRRLAVRLQAFSSRALYERCAAFAREQGAQALVTQCEQDELSARNAEARKMRDAANRAGQSGNYAEAVNLLAASTEVAPLGRDQVQLMLRAALKVGDQPRVALGRQILILRGMNEATVDGLIADLREQNAAEAKAGP